MTIPQDKREAILRAMMEGASIYALADANTGEIRYIGKANDPAKRLQGHMSDSIRRESRSTAG